MKTNRKFSRRSFLRHTAAAVGAGLAVPNIVSAATLGRGGAKAPSERINMGFIGAGHQGSGHLLGGAWTYVPGGYSGRKDVQVLAVCDIWPERRETAVRKVNANYAQMYGQTNYNGCQGYHDFREMIARPDIDAVLICTPAHWHATMTVMTVAAGKDVYCEKPSAATIQESQAIRAAVKRYGRVYQTGTQQRSEYGGKFRMACEFIRSGRIGKLKEVYVPREGGGIAWPWPNHVGPQKPAPPGFDWDLYLGPVPWFPCDGKIAAHRFDIGELNWAQHHYDIVQWAADADETGPVELFIAEDRTAYKYASGVVVYGHAYPGEKIGMQGGATFVGTHGRIAVDRDNIASYPANIISEPLRPDEVHLYRDTGHANNFVECIRTRQRTICNEDVAHHSVNAVLLGGIVKQLRRPLKWDPAAEKFVNDDGATRLCSIAKRAPWNCC